MTPRRRLPIEHNGGKVEEESSGGADEQIVPAPPPCGPDRRGVQGFPHKDLTPAIISAKSYAVPFTAEDAALYRNLPYTSCSSP